MSGIKKNREVAFICPLGNEVLRVQNMIATEELGRLFTIELELESDEDINFEDLLGQNVSICLELRDDTRYFNGYIGSFSQSPEQERNKRSYHASVHPWLWFLGHSANCRIFQHQTVPEIIKSVFKEHGFSDILDFLSHNYQSLDYCVQYRETDFNFVSRLMEKEGIYYYFIHEKDKHSLCLADDFIAHHPISGYKTIPYYPATNDASHKEQHICNWHQRKTIQPGIYSLTDYDFKKPKADLTTKAHTIRDHSHASYEVYDYPGEYTAIEQGDSRSRTRIQEHHTHHEQQQGESDARGLITGGLFTLKNYPRHDQNRQYLVCSVTHSIKSSASDDNYYSNHFKVISCHTPFRSRRITPKPIVQGPQTAVVVGPEGEEIYTDEHGRVKLHFHWDRLGKRNENSSCWVRVSQLWAGKQWGAMHIPRIGQEVIVEFEHGDPDQPIITGRVYNALQKPPYPLPANKTQSGIKSRSSKGGFDANFNEFRFEDKKGHEQVYLHAEKNMDTVVENSETHSVGVNRNKTIGKNETTHVGHNRSETVDNNETLVIKGFKAETVIMALAETVGLGKAETIGLGKALTIGVDYAVTVGKDIIVNAGDSISLTVGKAKMVMEKDGTITITGTKFNFESSGPVQITGKDVDIN